MIETSAVRKKLNEVRRKYSKRTLLRFSVILNNMNREELEIILFQSD